MICPPDSSLPLPDPLDECLAAEGVAVLPLLRQLLLDDVLGGDAGMVGAGHPQHFMPGHPLPAHQDILQGIVEGMPHVQHAGDVGRRDDDRIAGLGRVLVGVEITVFLPLRYHFASTSCGSYPLASFGSMTRSFI